MGGNPLNITILPGESIAPGSNLGVLNKKQISTPILTRRALASESKLRSAAFGEFAPGFWRRWGKWSPSESTAPWAARWCPW